MKTNQSLMKRLKITGTKKIVRASLSAQHLARRKAKRRRRSAKKYLLLKPADTRRLSWLIN